MGSEVEAERARLRAECQRRSGRRTAEAATHFGVRVQRGSKNGLRLVREEYARINKRSSFHVPRELHPAYWDARAGDFDDDEHRFYTDEWCEHQREEALENFDLNIAFMRSLDAAEFEEIVTEHVASRLNMRPVYDLNEWDHKPGIYVMVLDDYRQVYVGTTSASVGVKERVRQHWRATKPFDRLLFGGVDDSILSIDSFRALDTTRIFALTSKKAYDIETPLVESIPPKFRLNRIVGGEGRMIGVLAGLRVDIVKRRDLHASSHESTLD